MSHVREARTRGACVSSVRCTRVLVCRTQGSERGSSGEDWRSAHIGNREIGKSGNREPGTGNREAHVFGPRRAPTYINGNRNPAQEEPLAGRQAARVRASAAQPALDGGS